MHSPVLLIIFNRPDTTARVLTEIAKAKPAKLFVFGDGPRPDRPADKEKCAAARAVVRKLVDWDCELIEKYLDENLGCGKGPASAISWVFEQADRAIILEDDCLPHPSFFRFCDEVLEKYLVDQRVMHVAGNNFQFGIKRTPFSYFFSYFNHPCGGWATWRRAWMYHDLGVRLWSELRETSWLQDIVEYPNAVAHWQKHFAHAHEHQGRVDYWDFQWSLACWSQNGLSISPNSTLVSNIGFGHPEATHTKSDADALAVLTGALNLEAMTFPLRHPTYVRRTLEADRFYLERVVLPSLQERKALSARLPKPLASFIQNRPSLSNPSRFFKRLREKALSSLQSAFNRVC